MINKLFVSFMLAFLLAAVLSGIMEGGGGIKTASLTVAAGDADVVFTVNSTEGFLTQDVLFVGNEQIQYIAKTPTSFTGLTRGFNGTDAAPYAVNEKLYTAESNAINAALGFNVASTGATVGDVNIIVMLSNLFFVTLPKLITWDFSWLRTDGMQLVRYVLLAISTGLIISFALMVASALGGIMRSIFVRV